jgi:hypothetical protein
VRRASALVCPIVACGAVGDQVDRVAVNTERRSDDNAESRGGIAPGFRQSVNLSRCDTVATQKKKPVDKQDPKNADAPKPKSIKTTLSLDVDTYVKLHAKAAMRHVGISTLAVEFIKTGLKGVVAFDKSESYDRGKADDRPDRSLKISSDADEAAA